ncbi:MAG: HAD family hydrolase, partial [Propionibacteriaceae bacterium]|nr:HAD family hydrolase [Propionibacteriaceae bacterium]
ERDIAAEYGKVWTDEQANDAVGIGGLIVAQRLLDLGGDTTTTAAHLSQRRFDMVAERVASEPLAFRPGAEALLDACADVGLPCAVVSTSPRHVLAAGLNRMPDRWFAAVVDGDAITHHKPDPEGYLTAARRLDVDPADCLVIEDSEVGCAAGRASGAVVLAVPNMTPLPDSPGQVIRDSLVGLTVKDVEDIWLRGRKGR